MQNAQKVMVKITPGVYRERREGCNVIASANFLLPTSSLYEFTNVHGTHPIRARTFLHSQMVESQPHNIPSSIMYMTSGKETDKYLAGNKLL